MKAIHIISATLIIGCGGIRAAENPSTGSAGPESSDPRKLDDPEALRKSHPVLAEQPCWKDFAKPEEITLFDGPETAYPEVSADRFDLTGFDPTLLGSKVPPVGVHPRVLFSPEDMSMLKRRLEGSKLGRKACMETSYILSQTLYNPSSDEGKIFGKLASGDCDGLRWLMPETPNDSAPTAPPAAPDHWFVGYRKTLGSSVHTAYLPNMLAAAAFQCQLSGDETHGKRVAAAIANYYKMREPMLDHLAEELQTKRVAPNDYWRSISGHAGGNNLAFCYDLAAAWMDAGQKAVLRRVIAKTTSHRLGYGMNGPARWAETNWSGWDLEHYITALAIEGEEGFDPAIPEAARRCLKGYLQWGINANGTIFECNGKNGSGFHYAMLSAIAFARRGDNLFGHPHLRKLPAMQAQAVVPSGGVNVNNGTWGCAGFGYAYYFADFFPKDQVADFLLRQSRPDLASLDLDTYRRELEGNGKNPGSLNWRKLALLTPAHTMGPTPYACMDWHGADDPKNADQANPEVVAETRRKLKLPFDFVDPIHGLLQTRSGDGKDSLFLMFEARPDLSTIGHQHHDAGHFYLAANGEMWAVEAGPKSGYSIDHNAVRIDGLGLADVAYPPHVRFLGAATTTGGALATANITNAYNYGWVGPTQFQWLIPQAKTWKISVETDPDVVAFFRGTQNYKMRIWGDHYWKQNWGPTMRVASANPVKSAFRTVGIVRGKHPYALVLDDVDKGDGKEHMYEWVMQVPSSARLAEISLPSANTATAALVKSPGSNNWSSPDLQPPAKGTPALLVTLLDVPVATTRQLWNIFSNAEQPLRLDTRTYAGNQPGEIITRSRLYASRHETILHSRIALIPFRIGEVPPTIHWDASKNRTTVQWHDQKDELEYTMGEGRTNVKVVRDGNNLLSGGDITR